MVERWDGTGYPRGLAGPGIPHMARIFAVVDAWDALRSHRPYKRACSLAESIGQLELGAGSHFEPLVVEQFLRLTKHPRR
jgi:HD-GYP domain-containing protein (c-di-GMP phosphodiesterase class II)